MRVDLVQRDDCHPLLEFPVLQQLLSDNFILNDDVVELSTCGDLESGRLAHVRWIELD